MTVELCLQLWWHEGWSRLQRGGEGYVTHTEKGQPLKIQIQKVFSF